MKIKETVEGKPLLEWKIRAKDKPRRSKGKHGAKRCFHAVQIRIPQELLPLITNDKKYTYIYEYFDKVCLTPEPPENQKYTKMKLISANLPTALLEVPAKIFETSTMKNAIITYEPDKEDYSTGKKGLIRIDEEGTDKRKWIKREIKPETQQIQYSQHIQTLNTPPGTYLHQDLLKIINPQQLYIYQINQKFYLTDIQPTTEHIQTNEENLIDDLKYHHIIQNSDEKFNLLLSLKELDPSNHTKPKIEIEIQPPEK